MKNKNIYILFIFIINSLGGMGQDSIPLKATRPTKGFDTVKVGIASYYDNKFVGRRTSNGEIFSQNKLTAASNRLPLNSWAKVTHLKNGRSVVVRITDRMHPKNQRLIDLSRAAASKLLFTGAGLAKVRVEYLGKKQPSSGKSNKKDK